MKRSSIFAIALLSALFLALIPIKAVAIQIEAVFGEPFGVCRIELPLSTTEQELHKRYIEESFFEMIHQASVSESNKRALYPTWSIIENKPDGSQNKALLFLFQGQDELDVFISRIGFEELIEKVKIKPVKNDELLEVFIDEWWNAYLTKLKNLHYLDFYDPSVELGIVSMMGRRLGLPLDNLRYMFRYYYNEFNNIFDFLLGTESIRLAMQTDTMLKTVEKGEGADIDLPDAAALPPMPVPDFNDNEVIVESLAMRVPEQCFYLRFDSFSTFLQARDFMDRWGTMFRSILSSRGADYSVSERIERQLALKETVLSRYFGSSVIDDVAVIGTDTFLREGAAIGVLFHAKETALLKKQLDSIRDSIKKENSSVRESSEIIEGRAVSLLSSPGGEVRSFYVEDGDFHLVTTSKWIAQAFLSTGKAPGQSLGNLTEFRYARSQIASSEKGIFIYLSDPFFRVLVGPAYRVEMTRRAQSVSEMNMLALARLAAIQEGHDSPSIASLIEKGFLPKGFGMRHDNSKPMLDEDGTATDSVRGAIGSFLPIPDMTIDKVTTAEAKAYQYFADAYDRMWTNMDPVFGLLVSESTPSGEQLELRLNISPYAKSRYGDLDTFLGKPDTDRMAIISGDLVFFDARLSKKLVRELIPEGEDVRIFVGLRDTNIPWSIEHGNSLEHGLYSVQHYVKFYSGIVTPLNFDEESLGFMFRRESEPDAAGYAKLRRIIDTDLWYRRFGSYRVIGSGRSLLEAVTPEIRVEKTEHPSQVSLNLGDFSNTYIGNCLRAEAYTRDRRTSAGNALLLHAYQQQLQPSDLNGAIKAIQNQSLICPLGGTYVPAEQPGRWKSTAWTDETLYQTNNLPDNYSQTIIDEMKALRLEFSIDPDTIKTRLEIKTKRQGLGIRD
ncbi:MAG: hypothetical protein FWF87_03880 [Synergistaceae bacterium]|nr:hypothetical protein [Synergistaceae bacterium]